MIEARRAPDGRVATSVPDPVDHLTRGDCGWLCCTRHEGQLRVALLTDMDVADWTPLVPQDGATA